MLNFTSALIVISNAKPAIMEKLVTAVPLAIVSSLTLNQKNLHVLDLVLKRIFPIPLNAFHVLMAVKIVILQENAILA